jgi:hypothetical protein
MVQNGIQEGQTLDDFMARESMNCDEALTRKQSVLFLTKAQSAASWSSIFDICGGGIPGHALPCSGRRSIEGSLACRSFLRGDKRLRCVRGLACSRGN